MSTQGLTCDQLMDRIYELRAHGYRISTEQYVTAYNLLVTLAASSDVLENPAQLRPLLAPVFCTSAEEQQTFYRLFDSWVAPQRTVSPDPPQKERDPQNRASRPHPTRRGALISSVYRSLASLASVITRTRLLVLLALALSAGLGVLAHQGTRKRLYDFFYPRAPQVTLYGSVTDEEGQPLAKARVQIFSDRFVNVTTLTSLSAPTATTDDAGQFALTLPASRLPASVTINQPGYNTATERAEDAAQLLRIQLVKGGQGGEEPSSLGRFVMGAIIATLLAGAAFYVFRSRRRLLFKKGLTRGDAEQERLWVERAQEHLTQYLALRRTAQGLRERRSAAAEDLNVELTVEATVRRGGLFTPVYSVRRLPPEYLVLIDRNTFKDQWAELQEAIVKRLIANGVYIDWFYFQDDPRLCRRERPEVRYFTLQELAARYPDHNLIIFSDGAGLFDPVTGYPQDWLELFDPWPKRAILTPEPYASDFQDWIWSELGFLVLPADKAGLTALGGLMSAGAWGVPDDVTTSAKQLPSMLREQPNRWLERHPPPDDTIDELCEQLREFLDPDVFLWLSACAVYPKLDWDVALRLGYELMDRAELEENLLTLARLPWFNHGTMPDWLRKSLISNLTKEEERETRKQIDLLLVTASSEKAKEVELTFTRALRGATRRGWEEGLRRLRRVIRPDEPEDDTAQDQVFLSFMSGFRHKDPLAVLIPAEVRSMLMRLNQSVSELYPLNLFMALLFAGYLVLTVSVGYASGNVGVLLSGVATSGLFALLLYQVELQTLRWEKATGAAHRFQAPQRYTGPHLNRARVHKLLAGPSGDDITSGQLTQLGPKARSLPASARQPLGGLRASVWRRLARSNRFSGGHDFETAGSSAQTDHRARQEGKGVDAERFGARGSGKGQRLSKIGLYVLTTAELWERFSFYSMLVLFTLYLQDTQGGFGWARDDTTLLYSIYLFAIYFSPLVGGIIADLKLGHRKSVMIGGFSFLVGYFLLTFPIVWVMYLALVCLVVGNGFFKPNVSAMVGNLYPEGSHLKDRAYNIFYMGINVGAFVAPIVMEVVKQRASYPWAFAVAAGGMVISLLILWLFKRHIEDVDRPSRAGAKVAGTTSSQSGFGISELRPVGGLCVFFAIVILFWMFFHQNGVTWTYWATDNTDWGASSTVQILMSILTLGLIGGSDASGVVSNALNPSLGIVLTFPLIWFWGWLDRRGKEPSTMAKMAIGMMLVASAYLIMSLAAVMGGNTGRVSPWWLIGATSVITLGELMLSPMGLSLVSKAAPVRVRGLMMGGWIAAIAIGNYLTRAFGVMWAEWTHSKFFFVVAAMCAAVGLLLFLLLRPLKKWMPGIGS